MDEKKLQQQQQVRNTLFTIDKELPEYHAGIREGRRQERGYWVQVLDGIDEIDEKLIEKIMEGVAQMY